MNPDHPSDTLELSPEQLRLLALLLEDEGLGAPSQPDAILPRSPSGGDRLPLSFAQQRLWLADRLEPGSAAYNVPVALRLRGALELRALEGALGEIVRRHESLRTVFAEVDGEPVQTVREPAPVSIEVADLAALPAEEREETVRREVRAEASRPFDLARGPLLRARLLRTGADEAVALFTLHHIVSDGWSTGVLVREISALYDAFSRGEPSPLPDLPVQYADYAVWQRRTLSGEALEAQLAYWRERLRGAPPLLELPTDRPRPDLPSREAGSRPFTLGPEATAALRALARAEGATLFAALLAGWQALLARWSGQDDVLVGTPVANRGRAELEGLIGFLVNTLVLRADLSGDPTGRELLARTRASVVEAQENQDVPFERLVEELVAERTLRHAPLFQVMFSLQEVRTAGTLRLDGVEMEPLETETGAAKFDLALELADHGERIVGRAEYRAELFDGATVERLLEHYAALLAGMAADPERRVSEIGLLGEGERRRVVEEWNATERAFEGPGLVHEGFAAQARRTPDAVAVRWAGGTQSYAELERESNRLARHLQRRGVGAEARVGICMERGPEMVAAVLGVLKAGAAYVPLDPEYPAERLAWMLEDSGAGVLLATRSVAERLPSHAVDTVLVDEAPTGAEPDTAPGESVSPGSLAYVIYTSGSTGRPKGVAVPHGALSNHMAWMGEEFPLGAGDRVLQKTSFSFDASVWELWAPLLSGAELVLAAPGAQRDPAQLVRTMAAEGVTVVQFVPTQLQVLLEEPGFGELRGVRRIFCGGEAFPAGAAARALALTGAEVVNLYGPTEACIDATWHVPTGGETRATLPIGRPVANVRAYVLERGGAPAPVGVPGELYLGGAQLARGYLGRPELTAERFVPDPFGGEPGARLYRTGDRARWLAEGGLEYLGRADEQVKLRGFRVEPGEVEAALLEHPAVREAAVAVRGDRLVGYVVAENGGAPEAGLRGWLRERLPEHLVPSAVVALDALPRTPAGKLARRALPAPDGAAEARAYVAPRTPTERLAAEAWAAALQVERVGALDGFFELGGHSLLGTRVVSHLREALGVEVPLRAVFEAPTLAAFAERVDALRPAPAEEEPSPDELPPDTLELSPEQLQLLALMMEDEGLTASHPDDVSAESTSDEEEHFPLSFAQQRLWLVDRLEPGSSAYNVPFALRLRGALDLRALEEALSEIVFRHESLHTVFAEVDGEPVQVIGEPWPVRMEVTDLAALPAEEREEAVRAEAREEASRPFDLARGPLLRARLLRTGADEVVALLTLHHIVSDEWSTGVLVRELSALYDAFSRGEPSPLPELPIQYVDYSVWQRRTLSEEALEAQLAHWRERLAGAPPVLELPTDRPRPDRPTMEAGSRPFALDAGTSAAFRALAHAEGATLFAALLAGWQALLARWSGQDDVLVGTPVANRGRAELEGLIGFLVNTLVLRADLSDDPTVRQLLARTRTAVWDAQENQDVPFERLVEELVPERSLAHSPLFQVMFSFQGAAGEDVLRLGGVEMELLDTETGRAKFDLLLSLVDAGERIVGRAEYRAELFDGATVERLLEHYAALLAGMAADPERRVSEIGLLGEGERRRVVAEWNATERAYPSLVPVHEGFAAQARRTPDAVAVRWAGGTQSYAELERESNRLARHLQRRGVGAEARVGICMERGPEMVAAVLGVLKAGAAYVPLDPEYPAERLAWMLEDSGAGVLLATRSVAERLPSHAVDTVLVDEEPTGAEPDTAPGVSVSPGSLAYVIYTSGSTGRPKGVAVPHGALSNHMAWMGEEFPLGAGDRVLQKTSFSFDASVWELWAPLLSGAELVLAAPGAQRDPAQLVRTMAAEGVTVVQFVPTQLQVLLEEPGFGELRGVRRIFCGGEAFPAGAAARARALTGAEVVNLYGPTEACIDATWHVPTGEERRATLPIGRPVANVRAYVLERGGAPAPVGVPGELYLGGAQLARGYLGRAELTAERFVPDPFGGEPGARVYRTGDRARWLAEGRLEYLGRADEQVKLRGFRVEPGEVEAALLEHPAVREAVVVVREDAPGEKRLVAYVVAGAGEAPAPAELRGWLRERLPEHLVPSAVVALDALPRTPAGKLARRALPAPDRAAGDEAAYVEPRTPTERAVAEIWSDVLGAARVGAGDGFFELGGHSLLGTRVVSRVRQALGVEVPLRTVFEATTLAAFAARVDAAAGQGVRSAPVERALRGERLPLSFAQQRLWLLDRLEPGSSAYNVPVAVRLRGALEVETLARALSEVVRRHEVLRTVFAEADGEPVQTVRAPEPVRIEVVDLPGLPEAELRRLARAEAARPFDLARGPLLRARLLRTGGEEAVALFTMHHVVSDAWSAAVLVREVSALYGAFSRGEPSPLPDLPVQYADYALWQRRTLSGEALEAQLAFWRGRLAGAPPLLELPTDRPRPAVAAPRAGVRRFELSPGTAAAVHALARAAGTTPFAALLAGWQALLARWSGQDDVLVGTPVANRGRAELEGLIGFFMNTLVLRADLSDDPTGHELLARTRAAVVEAQENQDLPFERLVEELGVERSLRDTPLFQVLFTVQDIRMEAELRLGGVQAEPLETGTGEAKFDLTLGLGDDGERIAGSAEFRAELFDDATVDRLLEHYAALLAGIAADPERRVSEIELLGEAERRLVVEEWNDTAADGPDAACAHHLVEAQAGRTPDAVAVSWEGGALTYAELELRAGRLAGRLRALGVGPDARVGLCLERGPEMMVAVLGILKAGAAYVPLDPRYPAERLAYMLAGSGARAVVAEPGIAERLPELAGEVVPVDGEAPAEAPEPSVGPDNLAYVIYTSGSTGTPKGVAMPHRPLVSLVAWQLRAARLPAAATLQFASLSFDVSFQEIFSTWAAGGRLVLVDEERRRDPAALLELLDREEVEQIFLPFVALQQLAEEAERRGARPRALREVVTAGEQLRVTEPVRRWLAATGATLSNQYGPSETHVATEHPLQGAAEEWPLLPPVGRPVANARAYVLDRHLRPAPVGVPGELYLGGGCLARGYLGRPELTAERFLPDALAAEPGARAYRTGDRARWTPRGELEFLGRADDQAKVRGFRVEPGEVEAVLERHPAVARAVAVVREDEPGERRLVGYVVPAEGAAAPAPAELRAWLAERLPEHMVPSALVALDAFPLTPSGKVARRALPAPDGAADGGEYVAPRTPTEETVAAIWAGLLKRGRVGARDSFFELGGHSLLGTRVVSRLRDAFGVEVPLRVLFEAPVLAAFAERVDALRPVVSAPVEGDDLAAERAELLALMMEDAGVPEPGDGAVRPQVHDEGVFEFPLSFAQQRLWFIDQLEPGSAVYNMPFALRVRGAVRVEALERALEMLVERHESLRTVFTRAGDGEPVQVVCPPWAPPVPVEDLRALPAAEREAELRRLATAEAERPFDLAEGPLVRAFLARLGEEEWGMFFTMHHIVSDGWSMAVLVREVSELYGALSEGREPSLPALPVQYADFAVWQRDWLVGETLEAQLAWWRGALAGAPPALELPTDRPRPATASAHAESRSFQLSPGTSRALRALSRGEGATLFMAMLAGFQALLSRWSGQEDVTVGTPIAGRTRSELEELIGFFVNTLVLRADLSGDPSFRALLGRVRENTLGAFQHQDLPFEKLVEELQPERALGHTPLFQVMFSMQNVEDEQLRLGALETEPLELGAALARFDLSLATYEAGERLAGGLVFRTDLFDGATAERLLDHYVRLLDGAAARPDRRLSELDLLAPDERAQLLLAWNATDRAFPAERCVHELVAEQAARTPDAVAVVSRGGRLTYAELEARSGALAGRLRAEGVRPDDRVGLFLERSADAVVGVLGILRAGAAYLALDPGYPDERLLFMLEDSGARALVTHAPLEGRLEAFAGARVDVAGATSLPAPEAAAVSPRNLAYVIYTSGSTGTPKGVLVEHRGLVNYLSWFDREVLGEEGFDLPLVSRLSFDAHVRQLFPPLLRGEAVWVLPEETVTDPRALLEAISGRERVSFGGVPSLWGAMVELIRSGEAPKPGGLKAVLLGGEALSPELVERTRALYPDAAVWNHYGPTEATVNTTVARVDVPDRISIGRPVANVRVYLLDRQGSPVPVGVPGELHVGGTGVTRGYLGRPELTAERFVPDPYSGEIGARMYRSGDRVRWRADGELDYVGRVDFQVKVRGFRIEPGEVETVLERHPEVREAAVVVRGERLVGYVVAEGSGASVAELRGWLKERLPEYMVPAALVVLERLPLTPNGKVDRRALPEPEESGEDFVAPRTPAEEILAGIYAAVLGVERVGAEDDFFALGGHSLIATRVISRVREAFRVEVPLRALFEAPTVAGLAEQVDALLHEGAGTGAPPVVPVPRDGSPLPLSFAQQRLWFIDQLEPGTAAYNIAYALRLHGALDVAAFRGALGEVVRRHESLRTVFGSERGEPVQVVLPPAPVPLPVSDLRGLPAGDRDAEVLRLAREEAGRPFDLARGPLLRAGLARLDGEEWALFLTLHHIVSDGWSRELLVAEVAGVYEARLAGRTPVLPELPVQYADYAAWQRAWLTGETLERQLAYWRERLEGAPPLLEIPTDRPRTPVPGVQGAARALLLPPGTARALRGLAREEGSTLFMALLAGWQALLARWSGQDDVLVGTPIAGRTRMETENLIGFFVNTLVMRADLSGAPTARELLARVRDGVLEAHAHQDVPFEKLVEELHPERSLRHAPFFQVMFAFQEAGSGRAPTGGLRMEPLEREAETAMFDLTLSVVEDGERLAAALTYRPDLFDGATVERMLGHYGALLEGMAETPDRPVAEAELPGEEERRLLAEWSRSEGEGAGALLLHGAFEARVRSTPEALAAVAGDERLTYAELDRRAERLARLLRARGVGPESRVAACTARDARMPVAAMAILKAGGVYLPLDPAYPAERLAYMLADSGVRLVVSDAETAGVLPDFPGEVLLLGPGGSVEEDGDGAADAPAPEVLPRNAAYLIYTSGSTGRPKGVVVEHGAAAAHFLAFGRMLGLGPEDRVLHFAAAGFDVSLEQIFVTLLAGASMAIRAGEPWSPAEFPERARALGVTVANLPPAYWHEVVERGGGSMPGVRLLLLGGDALPSATVRRALGAPDAPRLVNGYGPTEGVVSATVYEVPRGFPGAFAGPVVPIGRLLPARTAHVLDRAGLPAPLGAAGDLHLGGSLLARGYLGRPELTAERFVPDPFSDAPGARLYRTGDRVRWLADGTLEFLGRVDQQVKIRGFRIEPGEIEAHLLAMDEVREAVVTAREEGAGERRLVAYLTAAPGAALPETAELRGRLRERLPEHMVPSAFVALDALPLTPHGKLDRRALPAPERTEGDGYVAPRSAAEATLAGIWAEVLGVERVGVEDDFFALGGHSLLATRVAARVAEAFGTHLPVRALFEAPTVARLAERVAGADAGSAAPPLLPVEGEDGRRPSTFPLSFAQQRLWFLDQLEPGSAAYNVPVALRLRGALDVAALERALTEVVRRHEVLRTVFRAADGGAVAEVRSPAPAAIPVTELGHLPEAEREAAVLRRVREEATRPFDLSSGPLLRAALLRLGGAEWALLFTLHHVVSDGWSMGVLVREVSALYAGEPLPPLPVQYGDYAVWQRRWLSGATLEAQLAYWRERLAGAPATLELPTDRPPAASPSAGAAYAGVEVPAEVAVRLRALAREEGASSFMALLAGWQALLSRWSGEDDVLVGTPVAGRTRREVEELIGFFVNTLVVRTDLSGAPGFRELLRRVRDGVLEAQSHQDVPFEKLVEELHPERDLHGTPFFRVMFTYTAPDGEALRLGEVEMEGLGASLETAKFDLSLAVVEDRDRFWATLTYRTELWDAATAERMLRDYGRVLAAMAADPATRVPAVELLDGDERRLLVEEWAAAESRAPSDRCVHELFAEQAARTPDALALVSGGERVTYAELDRRSDGLAHVLAARGVGPDVRVGICAERSPELVVGLLGILKAGGAYVPLDPGYPVDRLAYMLADSAVPVLLAQERVLDRLPEFGGEVMLLDGEEGLPAPEVRVTPDHLCYVIYTSGSTGRPKGTEVPHRAIPGFFWDVEYARFDESTVLLQHSSTSWDALTLELWPALLRGGTCVLLPAQTSEPALLGEQIREHGVTATWISSAYFNSIVDTTPEVLSGLRLAMIGGEAVSIPHVRRALERFPELRIVNGYGPSECTVFTSCYPIPADFDAATIPIGRPVGDRRVYLLDRDLGPVPVGVAGELFVGGPAVARGYHDRPELTAERFVPDPFSGEPGARLYRSGDRVKWRADGLLEFVGRVDFQVKVRGFRVEPGEVEGVLASHPGVREAAVVVRDDASGAKALVGYAAGTGVAGTELRAWLRERMPEYMVPAVVVVLDALPLTPHGKTDRRALPAPESFGADEEYVAPRTPTEEVLAGIWEEVLGVERVGARTGFFDLGGHSLLATRVVSRAREAFGTEVPLRALFEAPTVAGLAARVDALVREGAPVQAPPIVPVPRDGEVPLSFAQQRLWFIDQLTPGSTVYNIPAALRIRGALDVEALERTLGEVVRRHEALRTTIQSVAGRAVQVIHPAGPVALPVVDLRGGPEDGREAELRRRVEEEESTPFDLGRGPLFRARLLRLDEEEWALLVTMHHVVSDGWSVDVMTREVTELYAAFREGRPSPLPELPVQYADYAAWQRAWLTGETLEAQLAWWREQLAGAPPVLEIPTDRPRPRVPGPEAGHRALLLPRDTALAARALARREGSTLFMTLLAAFQAVLARWSGQEDVSVGMPIAGRNRTEVEGLIGFFVNTLVVRTRFEGGPDGRELLRRVRETTLGAFQHQDVPFEKLVEELGVERSLSHTPLFQASFGVRNVENGGTRLAGAEVEPIGGGGAAAKFDLGFTLTDAGEELPGSLTYRAELFDAATMDRLLEHFALLLRGMAERPDTPVAELPLLAEWERRRVLEEWGGPRMEVPAGLCVHHLVEAEARRAPGAPAVAAEDGRLTYAELDARANRLASHLRGLGVGPEVRVGVCLDRGAELVVALLAVLKAGGAYVPLDPVYPAERQTYMLADSEARVLVTHARLEEGLAVPGVRVVRVDADRERIAAEPAEAPESGAGPENLSHVIYTSGSTGRPKGVMIRHRSAVVMLRWLREQLREEDRASVLASTSVSFDVSVAEIFGALSWGGKLVVVGNALDLARLPEGEEVRVVSMVPSAAAELLRMGAIPAGVRVMNLGGEALPSDLAQGLYALGTVESVGNLYGPSEDTTYTTYAVVERGSGEVLIGRPVAETRIYLLDPGLQPVPIGVVGELWIAGEGLARGYQARPDMTAERFLPDPFAAEPGGRMYRTGDRVRWRADGSLDYLGRFDHQVKVRGFRIEPGEIEVALRAHPGVREAVVVVREDVPGDRRLVAYLAPPEGAEAPAAAELRTHLRAGLPEHMVPSAFVALERLPLTPNGKVDRMALPAPDAAGTDEAAYVAPRTPTEEAVARVWQEVLGVGRVGVNDNFFDLGGHSLLLVQLHSRLKETLAPGLSLADLFGFRTLADLAKHVDAAREAGEPDTQATLDRADARRSRMARQRAARPGRPTRAEEDEGDGEDE